MALHSPSQVLLTFTGVYFQTSAMEYNVQLLVLELFLCHTVVTALIGRAISCIIVCREELALVHLANPVESTVVPSGDSVVST